MTPRTKARTRRRLPLAGGLLAAALALTAVVGCNPGELLYFLQPYEPRVPGEGPELKGKRVVVVTRVAPGAGTDYMSLDRELTREVVALLKDQVRRIDIVPTSKVATWSKDHPSWTDPGELAEDFDADSVVYIEVRQFQIEDPTSPGMYYGQCQAHIRVVDRAYPTDPKGKALKDMPKEIEVAYDADEDTTFPIRGHMPESAEVTKSTFKNKFLKLCATEIAWHFVGRAFGDEIQDTNFTG